MIEFQNVHKTYRVAGKEIPALHPTSLTIENGQVYGLIGHSGAGKSTLLRLINRLENASGGKITVDGEEVTALDANGLRRFRQQVGMIFQHFNLLASKTVADNVALPLTLAGELSRSEIDSRVAELLARVGLSDHAKKYPAQLSGGQKQRVGIARALATKPKILLCDEATSALDPQTTASVLQLLAEINRELKLTIVLITGTSLGVAGAIPPLVVGATPFFARLVETALREVDRGIIEATQAMGATTRQIITNALLPEARPGIFAAITVTAITLVSYTAMAGVVGAGGLGDLAIRFGYQRFQTDVMVVTVVLLLVLVQVLQTVGDKLVVHFSRK